MTRFQRLASTVSVFAFLGLSAASVAQAAPEEAGQAEAARPHHGRHGHGGLLGASLRLDSLSATQRQQIDGLVAQEKTAHANVRVARGQLMQAIASGIDAGSINDRSITPSVQAVEGAIAGDEPSDRATLEKLHAVLTPAQRVELATRIESRTAKMEAHRAEADAKGPRENVGRWARGLGLSDAQRDQIEANLASTKPAVDETLRNEERATHQHVLEAFKGDRFVMNEIAPAKDPRLIAGEVEGMVRVAKASAPVLTVDQRATASAKLRTMATREAK
jgi:Spy/CpxP family protein refolding chaperone